MRVVAQSGQWLQWQMASGPGLNLTLASGVRAIHSLGPLFFSPNTRARRGWVAGAFSAVGESYVNEEPWGLSRIANYDGRIRKTDM